MDSETEAESCKHQEGKAEPNQKSFKELTDAEDVENHRKSNKAKKTNKDEIQAGKKITSQKTKFEQEEKENLKKATEEKKTYKHGSHPETDVPPRK